MTLTSCPLADRRAAIIPPMAPAPTTQILTETVCHRDFAMAVVGFLSGSANL